MVGTLQASENINERNIVWKQFQKYFKHKYLSDKYYDDKIKEFHELRLGPLTMEEYANNFLEVLMYVKYIKDEKLKITASSEWIASVLQRQN